LKSDQESLSCSADFVGAASFLQQADEIAFRTKNPGTGFPVIGRKAQEA
jgi:hypothetical protein